ncbi:hypothetical protein B9Z65_7694 [Elsinoe australis]|uniref:Uncharacterized protein n=1 Tax=Elsinoe australis TaxID=40998 RepID=A0A2P8A081_9PEZI|nr:hypothetical protein B9Z65_7694 [Elsinoe australis]
MGQAWSKESPSPGKEGVEEEEQSWIRGPGRRVSEEESARLARLDDVVWSPLGTRATLDRWRVPGLKVEPPAREVVSAGSGPDQQLLNKTMLHVGWRSREEWKVEMERRRRRSMRAERRREREERRRSEGW